jgi:GAF domain-containing protein
VKPGGGLDVLRERTVVFGDQQPARRSTTGALDSLVRSAAANIPNADLASISVRRRDATLETAAATSPLATKLDEIQYGVLEGPCYVAVTTERFILVNDLGAGGPFPLYGPLAAEHGVRAQLAMQLANNGEQAALNVYARSPSAFDRSAVAMAELFATQAGLLLGFAQQIDTLGDAVHTRQEVGTAIGIVMERYGVDRSRAFEFLTRLSSYRNIKIRAIAEEIIDGSFEPTALETATQGRSALAATAHR